MGIVVAKTIRNSGHDVYWASAGRSTESRGRASDAGLTDAGSVERLCEICAAIVSVCPPEFAEGLAREVAAATARGSPSANSGGHTLTMAAQISQSRSTEPASVSPASDARPRLSVLRPAEAQ